MSTTPPKRIDVEPERLRAIVEQSRLRPLTDEEHAVLEAVVEMTVWLNDELRAERLDYGGRK
jgi:hypothetical protein